MATGTVKWFDAGKGFGFIVPDDGSEDVFVHIRKLEAAKIATLEPGYVVSYAVAIKDNKRSATDLSLVSAQRADPQHREQRGARMPRDASDGARDQRLADSASDDFERDWGLRRS